MAGKAILTCRPNSHPFQERTLILEQPVKIGRAVARARSTPTNAIFDCKVLSRNHALFWYTDGKFYLQDTKSSNGTFVNNQRLSKSGEESAPREVCSGDIVQFGVDVLENTRQVRHGCIVANLKLFLPDGKEAKASHSSLVMSSPSPLPVEDLYQLNQYIQEAIQREQILENKLLTLQSILENIRNATDQGWKALIAEDRLLSRVEILENQLQTYSKSFAEDKVRDELRKLQEDKNEYQSTAKEFLKKVLEEKLDAVHKCQEIKRSLVNVETEYSNLCEQVAKGQKDIQELAQKLSLELEKNEEIEKKLKEIEDQHKETVDRLEARNLELETMLLKQHDTEASLERQVSELEVAGHLAKERASFFELQLRTLNNLNHSEPYYEKTGGELEVTSKESDTDRINECLEEKMKNEEVLELYSAQLTLLHKDRFPYDIMEASFEDDWNNHSKKHDKFIDIGKESEGNEEESDKMEGEREEFNSNHSSLSPVEFADSKYKNNNISDIMIQMRIQSEDKIQLGNDYEDEQTLEKDELLADNEEANDIVIKMCDNTDTTENEKGPPGGGEWLTQSLSEGAQLVNDKQGLSNCHSLGMIDDKKNKLKSQLLEAQQIAKQSKKEAAQMADRVKFLMAEIELKNKSLDNKTKDELDKKIEECNQLQLTISTLQSQISSLKEEYSSLQGEKEQSEKSISQSFKGFNETIEVPSQLGELQTKIQDLQEELVIVGTKYMHCNEERTKLSCELNSLRLDYQAVTHQPYFNLVFALPCLVLFVAIISTFYPTLSRLTGTSDNTHH